MLDGSTESYGDFTLTKRLVIIGPGYLLNDNGVIAEGSPSAQVRGISSNYNGAAGSIITGLDISGSVTLAQPNMVITRCRIAGTVNISTSASNCIIHQNYLNGGRLMCGSTSSTAWAPNPQITNNIFGYSGDNTLAIIYKISDGYIAYNTFTYPDRISYGELTGCTVENNVCVGTEITISGNTIQNNYWPGMRNSSGVSLYSNRTTDLTIKNQELSEEIAAAIADKGAFNGTDPYVISGIPAGPYISDITLPTSVEQGQTLKVNVKLGVQQ